MAYRTGGSGPRAAVYGLACLAAASALLAGCSGTAADQGAQGPSGVVQDAAVQGQAQGGDPASDAAERRLAMSIDGVEVPVTWEDNATVAAIREQAAAEGVTVGMTRFGGIEQYGPLGRAYPADDGRLTATCGDVVLYEGDKVVLLYGQNTWEYTRIGHMDLTEDEVAAMLSGADVTLSFSAAAAG